MAEASNRPNLRISQRLKVTPRGELIEGTASIPMLLQDISDEGFSLVCSRIFEVDEIYGLKFSVAPGSIIECMVEVRHSSEIGTGVKILTMNEQSRRIFDRYMEECFAHNLGRLP